MMNPDNDESVEGGEGGGGGGGICIEKVLLQLISQPDKSAFDMYYEYFKKYKLSHSHVNLHGNENRPNRAEKLARSKLFNGSRPDRPPAFFDFSNWSVRKRFVFFEFFKSQRVREINFFTIIFIVAGHQSAGLVGQHSLGFLLVGALKNPTATSNLGLRPRL